jgi:hypothetical protein
MGISIKKPPSAVLKVGINQLHNQPLKPMENKTLLQKIKYALDVLVDDSIARLEKNLQNQDEVAVKERSEIASFLIKISPIALKIVKVLEEEPVRGDFELTPEQIEEFQKFIKKYEENGYKLF